jgi:hypothetical protein
MIIETSRPFIPFIVKSEIEESGEIQKFYGRPNARDGGHNPRKSTICDLYGLNK